MDYIKEIVDYGIIGILIFMSVLSLALFLERFFYYKKVDIKSFSSINSLKNDLTKNLTAIATIASNAPYIGLLGTVLAIMQTFVDMSKENMAVNVIMSSLALALKTTAVGLLVAIVSVIFYNFLSRKAEVLIGEYEG